MDLFNQSNNEEEFKKVKSIMGDKWYRLLNSKTISEIANILKIIRNVELSENTSCFPEETDCFTAFKKCDPENVKVIIISQCPYPNENSDGIAFSSKKEYTESLKQIYFSLTEDKDVIDGDSYKYYEKDLSYLCEQGVLLINRKFRVLKGSPDSFKKLNWDNHIDNVITSIYSINKDVIVCSLGSKATAAINKIVKKRKLQLTHLTCEHPIFATRFRRLWYCESFTEINRILSKLNLKPIIWLKKLPITSNIAQQN
jgi:uracil-DNA glycosylase